MIVCFLLLTALLPQISESIFSPCLPLIAEGFSESIPACEHLFTRYLFGYSIGMLSWGILSDYQGRASTLRAGLVLYLFGVYSCYNASTLSALLVARSIQGIGGSACSVLVMAICRDLFQKEDRANMLAKLGMAMSAGPMLGPVIGTFILQWYHWSAIYVFLAGYGSILFYLMTKLPDVEHQSIKPNINNIIEVIQNRSIWLYALLIGCSCGIGFSFFSEGPFFFKVVLGLSDTQFSACFILIGLSWYLGGDISRRLLKHYAIEKVMLKGVIASTISCLLFILWVSILPASTLLIALSLSSIFFIMLGMGLVIGNAITLALEPFNHCSGIAASILGFAYYAVIALIAAGMAEFHDATLMALPSYWFGIMMVIGTIIVSIQPIKNPLRSILKVK